MEHASLKHATDDDHAMHSSGAWVLPAIVSSMLMLAWGGYTALVLYEILVLSAR